jgi:outer membrane lipoprotein LolB
VTVPGGAGQPARRRSAPRWTTGCVTAVLLVSGCASLAPLPTAGENEAISGRLSVRVEAIGSQPVRSFSAAFDLRGDSRAGVLGLSTPLGNVLAQARWSASGVTLATPQGTRAFSDLDGLTREVLGESVPVEAWFDWLRGRPSPHAPSTSRGSSGFEQLGWSVDLARLSDGRVTASRELPPPQVSVRIQLDAL